MQRNLRAIVALVSSQTGLCAKRSRHHHRHGKGCEQWHCAAGARGRRSNQQRYQHESMWGFTVPSLPASGDYRVRIEASGFKT